MLSKKMRRLAKQQIILAKSNSENTPPAEELENHQELLEDGTPVPKNISSDIRKKLREDRKNEGLQSFKVERRALRWQERRRRIEEGIIRTEWNVADGQLVVVKTPTNRQQRLSAQLNNANLTPGQTGIIIEMNDVLPSTYGKDGKNKKLTVLVGSDIQEWDASWIEKID